MQKIVFIQTTARVTQYGEAAGFDFLATSSSLGHQPGARIFREPSQSTVQLFSSNLCFNPR
ncbi:hypothetical protein H6G28_31365 [Nostoc sp. FACHB-190]|nr:hypothetical protein [Nostoc sp. FACHB-190]